VLSSPDIHILRSLVPTRVLPIACTSTADVVALISSDAFWPIHFCRQHKPKRSKLRFSLLNQSQVRSPRLRHYSIVLGGGVLQHDGDHPAPRPYHLLFEYPRQYSLRELGCMSPMPPHLEELSARLHQCLYSYLPPESRQRGPFNFVQVRGNYEALDPCTGPHSDNGQSDGHGVVDGGRIHWQAPNTAVVIYMYGPTPMEMDVRPTVHIGDGPARPPVTIPLLNGHVLIFQPSDDSTCKHRVSVPDWRRQALQPDGSYRIAVLFRHLIRPAIFDATTRFRVSAQHD